MDLIWQPSTSSPASHITGAFNEVRTGIVKGNPGSVFRQEGGETLAMSMSHRLLCMPRTCFVRKVRLLGPCWHLARQQTTAGHGLRIRAPAPLLSRLEDPVGMGNVRTRHQIESGMVAESGEAHHQTAGTGVATFLRITRWRNARTGLQGEFSDGRGMRESRNIL